MGCRDKWLSPAGWFGIVLTCPPRVEVDTTLLCAYQNFKIARLDTYTMAAGLRANARALEHPPAPKVGAPVLDPIDERDVETELRSGS
jgi:hypothetical protein